MLPPFIKAMLIGNAAVFLVQYAVPGLTSVLGLTPARFFSEFPNLIYQPLTYMFLHGNLGHIFFNMFALWMFGSQVEAAWGSKAFGRFYLFGGLSGALLTLIIASGQAHPMIGASAAVYAVLIAYWIMFPQRMLYIYFLFPVKVKYAIPGMMLLGFLFGGANVAHWAHLGGAVFGLIYLKSGFRFTGLTRRFKEMKYRRQEARQEKNRQKAQDVMKRVDAILDKISEVGIENISRADRKFLEEASEHLSEDEKVKRS